MPASDVVRSTRVSFLDWLDMTMVVAEESQDRVVL